MSTQGKHPAFKKEIVARDKGTTDLISAMSERAVDETLCIALALVPSNPIASPKHYFKGVAIATLGNLLGFSSIGSVREGSCGGGDGH
jgi:hypothetical protein